MVSDLAVVYKLYNKIGYFLELYSRVFQVCASHSVRRVCDRTGADHHHPLAGLQLQGQGEHGLVAPARLLPLQHVHFRRLHLLPLPGPHTLHDVVCPLEGKHQLGSGLAEEDGSAREHRDDEAGNGGDDRPPRLPNHQYRLRQHLIRLHYPHRVRFRLLFRRIR